MITISHCVLLFPLPNPSSCQPLSGITHDKYIHTSILRNASIPIFSIMAQPFGSLLALLLFISYLTTTMATAAYNVVDFGAKPDGRTDAAKAFLAAWAAACGSNKPATIIVPSGGFLVSQALFSGPCRNTGMRMFIKGTLMAPAGYGDSTQWITIKYMEGLSIYGGTLDGRGQAFWACKNARRSCPYGATVTSKNLLLSGIKLVNSELFHMSIFASSGITLQGATITAPGDSPNTDGIHIQMSSFVTITGSTMRTGDDCISMGPGTTNVRIENIKCGPGHGISIGSLGGASQEAGVQNITVRSVEFTGTQNGLRVKTWGRPSNGFVRGVTFEHAVMNNVENPIVVDQNYCPGIVNCPGRSSGIKISQVKFNDVQGTSATQVAVKLDCSPSNPCTGIELQDIKLTYRNERSLSYCKNVKGTASGVMIPPSCL
ncbi:hypothetical protein B296_00005114 [Ensete ventricosum]|uniref:Exopolygalacturonase n=1 Tax=Ensete ventricosum TaxID=4639 RepID=A0A426ZWY7_ENSVE|nr:hypothetical protein B296_00005114 [Ensete ventricosum]